MRAATGVSDGQHLDFVAQNLKYDSIRKPRDEEPPDVAVGGPCFETWTKHWVARDLRECRINYSEEVRTKSGPLRFVPVDGFSQIAFGFRMNSQFHADRA